MTLRSIRKFGWLRLKTACQVLKFCFFSRLLEALFSVMFVCFCFASISYQDFLCVLKVYSSPHLDALDFVCVFDSFVQKRFIFELQ